MENKYVSRIKKEQEYNEYREKENSKRLDEILEKFKKRISECDRIDTAVNTCEQFIHDCKWYEQQIAICGEIRRTLIDIKIDFDDIKKEKR